MKNSRLQRPLDFYLTTGVAVNDYFEVKEPTMAVVGIDPFMLTNVYREYGPSEVEKLLHDAIRELANQLVSKLMEPMFKLEEEKRNLMSMPNSIEGMESLVTSLLSQKREDLPEDKH